MTNEKMSYKEAITMAIATLGAEGGISQECADRLTELKAQLDKRSSRSNSAEKLKRAKENEKKDEVILELLRTYDNGDGLMAEDLVPLFPTDGEIEWTKGKAVSCLSRLVADGKATKETKSRKTRYKAV